LPKNSNQKTKILYLLNILLRETDEEHQLTMPQLLYILDMAGVPAERKSIYDDLEHLKHYGYDVNFEPNKGYYIGERDFELAELKLLVDSVQSSKFITQKKSDALIKKLEQLTSVNNAGELRRQVYIFDRVKTLNENIYYNVDKLSSAISKGCKVVFKYIEYKPDKTKHFKNDGADYAVSPYRLTFSDDNYYLIAYHEKYQKLSNFRVDRMVDVRLSDEKCCEIQFDLSGYSKKTFDMYNGETCMVQIECDNSLINAVIDRFGESVHLRKEDENTFVISVNVNISPTFFAWVFTFGDKMKIISPQSVTKQFTGIVQGVLERYET